jgi:hypothetical protein
MTTAPNATIARLRSCYDKALLTFVRLDPTHHLWTEAHEQLLEAREAVCYCETHLAKAQVQEATKVEPTKEEPAKSLPQQKSIDNARIAMANKGKTAKEKAEALDVPLSTVKKVEKAKATTTASKGMTSKDLRKAASELKIDVSKVNFRNKGERSTLEATIKAVVANNKSNQWQGLSASRQAQLNKLAQA